MRPATDRFMDKIERQADGCWRWTGAMHPWGYGMFNGGRKTPAGNVLPDKAHRFAYETFVGPIPDGLYIDHLCEYRACVNPAHLEPVSNAENIARKYRRERPDRCRNGHPWTPSNTRQHGQAGRACRRCHADYQNARYHAKRQIAYQGGTEE